jgi:ABC-type lipoprotein export system ATPase subunit
MAAQPLLLELRNLAKAYPAGEEGKPLAVLRGITLGIAAGESIAIVGPSGSGKSTLLNLVGALDHPTSGEVLFNGRNLAGLDELALADFRSREIGFIFQSHLLLPQCTLWENVLLPTLACPGHKPAEPAEHRATRLLARVGLKDRANHRPGQLSGGERQRAAVVRALINSPKLLLADEPTGSLDRAGAQNLAQLLLELNQEEGVTLILITHALELAQRMGRILELGDGLLHPTQP